MQQQSILTSKKQLGTSNTQEKLLFKVAVILLQHLFKVVVKITKRKTPRPLRLQSYGLRKILD